MGYSGKLVKDKDRSAQEKDIDPNDELEQKEKLWRIKHEFLPQIKPANHPQPPNHKILTQVRGVGANMPMEIKIIITLE